jgi:hypothetical protein
MGHVMAMILMLWVITSIWRALYKRWRQPRITQNQETQTTLVTTQIAIDCEKIVTDQMKVHMVLLQDELIPLQEKMENTIYALEERLLDSINSARVSTLGDENSGLMGLAGLLINLQEKMEYTTYGLEERLLDRINAVQTNINGVLHLFLQGD